MDHLRLRLDLARRSTFSTLQVVLPSFSSSLRQIDLLAHSTPFPLLERLKSLSFSELSLGDIAA